MKALILIVGDDPILLRTRAELLRDWQITTASSREAGEVLRSRPYDLVILSQTVQENAGQELNRPGTGTGPESPDIGDSLRRRSAVRIPYLPGGPEQPGWVAVCRGRHPGL